MNKTTFMETVSKIRRDVNTLKKDVKTFDSDIIRLHNNGYITKDELIRKLLKTDEICNGLKDVSIKLTTLNKFDNIEK